jgi:hypothetical protein
MTGTWRIFLWSLLALAPLRAWQQAVDYRIDVSLDTERHELEGTEVLRYHNRSPDTLGFLWFHLYPNAYRNRHTEFGREMEAMGMYRFAYAKEDERGFMEILGAQSRGSDLPFEVDGTRMKLILPDPLLPGDSIDIAFEFLVKIPAFFSRMGHRGTYYEIVQWYPKPAVYDQSGWHAYGYHAIGEFYGEFGSFDVHITLPEAMTVGATGILVEPESEIERMDALAIRGKALEALKGKVALGLGSLVSLPNLGCKELDLASRKTLRFTAERVHDFAWCASPEFRLIRDEFQGVQIDVLYLPQREASFRFAADHAMTALELYGRWYMPYPYEKLTVASSVFGGGMEYPTLVFIGPIDVPFTRLFETALIHEVGHQWFYGILGNDEMGEAWLDEGMNTFSEMRCMEMIHGRDRNLLDVPRPIPSIGLRWLNTLEYYVSATSDAEMPVLREAHRTASEPLAYMGGPYAKGALIVDMLRTLLGEEMFDLVMQAYFRRFRFRHPGTEDFIAVAEEIAGEDLGWFFDPWLRTTGKCDYALLGFNSKREGEGFETRVGVERRGEIRMPMDVVLWTEAGERVEQVLDGRGDRETVEFHTRTPASRVALDPEGRVLEIDRWNNFIPRKLEFRPLFDFPSFDAHYLWLGPSGSLNDYDDLRLGLWLRGGRFPDFEFVKGGNNFSVGMSYGISSRELWYDFAFETPILFGRNRIRLGFGIERDFGTHKAHFGISGRLSKKAVGPPEHRFEAGIVMRDIYNLEPLSLRNWEQAWTMGPRVEHGYKIRTYRFTAESRVGYLGSFRIRPGDRRYDRLFAELKARVRFSLEAALELRLFSGLATGDVPSQDKFFFYGALEPSGLARFIADGKGAFGTQEHAHIPGDGNMRGYIDQYRRDRVLLSANLEIDVPLVPLDPFFDAGIHAPEFSLLGDQPVRMDAGVELDLTFVRFAFPFWVSHPLEGEGPFAFRWLLEVGM